MHQIYQLVSHLTRLSTRLASAQVNNGRPERSGLSDAAAAVPDHTAGVSHQLNELIEWNVLDRSKVLVLFDSFPPHDTNHLFTAYMRQTQKYGIEWLKFTKNITI